MTIIRAATMKPSTNSMARRFAPWPPALAIFTMCLMWTALKKYGDESNVGE